MGTSQDICKEGLAEYSEYSEHIRTREAFTEDPILIVFCLYYRQIPIHSHIVDILNHMTRIY